MIKGCLALVLILTAWLQPAFGDAGEGIRALVEATLIDGTGGPPVKDGVVVIAGQKIECAGTREDCPVPDGAGVVDLAGRWILPGLVDAHVHFSQTGFYDGRPDAEDLRARFPYESVQARQRLEPARYLDAYLCAGITAVFDVGGFTWSVDMARRAPDQPGWPEIAASGPLITHRVPEILNLAGDKLLVPMETGEQTRRAAREFRALEADAIKLWFLPVEGVARQREIDPRVHALGEETRRLGIPLIAHATSLREAKVALGAGAGVLVHSVNDQPVDEAFIELARDRQAVYVPTLTVSRGYYNTRRAYLGVEPFSFDDPHGCVDPETRQRLERAAEFGGGGGAGASAMLAGMERRIAGMEEVAAANLRRVHEAGITIAAGSDAGNPGTLHGIALQAELEAMQAAGIEPAALIPMATRNGARAMGREDRFGTLESGKLANLIVLGADPSKDIANLRALDAVMLRGQWVDGEP